ncbi:MAG TPA: DUF4157 domain-containing protein [Niabella sp.]|nr:DUF4157 domain-containing protein [Niabella sp.]HRB80092.1 DUF4157 domain-containing protein [Niabella sp.]HRC10955.1 DUF4157 domain-containing protein [Niabella sp.]
MIFYTIKERSWIAKLASTKLRTKSMAIVFGRCIYLYGVSKEKFLGNTSWLRHELKHIEQYQRLGFLGFVMTYLWQTIRVGYHRCGLECEAREAENDKTIIGKFRLR